MASPKRKECTSEETVAQLEDLRTLLKQKRQTFREELKTEMPTWSSTVSQTLEKFKGDLGTGEQSGDSPDVDGSDGEAHGCH